MIVRAAHSLMFRNINPERFAYRIQLGNSLPGGGPEGRVWANSGEGILILGQSWTEVGARVFAEERHRELIEWDVSDEFVTRLGFGADENADSASSVN